MTVEDKLKNLKSVVDSLRYVKYMDVVMSSDHNTQNDALKLIYDILTEISVGVVAVPRPNRAHKAEVSLATARSDASLIDEWGLTGKAPFYSLTVVEVGDGVFTVKVVFKDGRSIVFSQAELARGFVVDIEFTDLRMTNTPQSVTNPVFVVDWVE